MAPYTVQAMYAATGEGVTIAAWVGMAKSPQDALDQFARFDEFLRPYVTEIREGVDDALAIGLIPPERIKQFKRGDFGAAYLYGHAHFNYS